MKAQPTSAAAPDAELDKHRRAVQQSPRSARAHADLGMALQRAGDFAQGVASQRRALELDPGMGWLHGVMAPALQALAQHEAAAESYLKAIALQPDNVALHLALGDVRRALPDHALAEASYRHALALSPNDPQALAGLGAALHGQGQFDAALESIRRALALAPELADGWLNLGATLHRIGKFEAAADAYQAVLKLRPGHFVAHINLGLSLEGAGQLSAALASFRQALEARPGDVVAQRHASAIMARLGRHQDALAERLALLATAPDSGEFHFDVGQSYSALGQSTAALPHLARAAALLPDDVAVLTFLALVQMDNGERDLSLASYRRAYELLPCPATHSNMLFALSHCCNDPHELLAEHLRFAEQFEQPVMALRQPHPNQPDPARQLKIGFVSADLNNHAIVTFIEPILELLTHSTELSLVAYSNVNVEDHVTARLRGYFAHWRSIIAVDDEAAERMIREDGIDILIDMSGHSGGNRLTLFARRPAPVQASWCGYAGTTGMEALDYYLSDGFHLPEGRYDDQFTEKIVRLPLGAPFMPEPTAPDISELPALRNGYITFGTFNRVNKLSRDVIALWARVLHAVPDARLVLGGLHPGADKIIMGWFRDQGIDQARLQLQPRGNITEYLAAHEQIDICLGAFPYTGTTTVCHALWMGVPTLTNTGPTNPSHAAVCHLAHLGLTSFVADNDDNFVDLAVFLSQNLDELAQLRATMRERFAQSVVGHPIVAASSLERALRLIWQRWCAGLPPESMRIRLTDLMTEEAETEA